MAHRARRIALLPLLAAWLLVVILHGAGNVRAQPSPAPAASVLPEPAAPPGRTELRGVWLTANDMPTLRDRERMQATVAQLAELNFNTLYAVAWNGGQP